MFCRKFRLKVSRYNNANLDASIMQCALQLRLTGAWNCDVEYTTVQQSCCEFPANRSVAVIDDANTQIFHAEIQSRSQQHQLQRGRKDQQKQQMMIPKRLPHLFCDQTD